MKNLVAVGVLVVSAGLSGQLFSGCSNDGSKSEQCQACSCFVVNNENIEKWSEVEDFNDCCYNCVLDELACTPGNGSCSYNNAKDAFEACGSATWPPTRPPEFKPP